MHSVRALLAALLMAACQDDEVVKPVDTCEHSRSDPLPLERSPRLQLALGGPCAVDTIPLTVTVLQPATAPSDPEATADIIQGAVENAKTAYLQCGLHLCLSSAWLIAVSDNQMSLIGNAPNSWGGAAPSGEDEDRFHYDENARIRGELLPLFELARADLPDWGIATIVVDRIDFFQAQTLMPAAGLSYPAVAYHHPDDFPLRNTILIATEYEPCEGTPRPLGRNLMAHELGHMLLDTVKHDDSAANVMSRLRGDAFSRAQCSRMQHNVTTLYGPGGQIDPGPPAG